MKRFILAALIALVSLFINEPLKAATIFHLTSSPASWVGQGETLTYTSPATPFFVNQHSYYTHVVDFIIGGDGPGQFELTLAAPGNTLLTTGLYQDATRWPFNGSGPGMELTTFGRGDNTLTGFFKVLQADYDTSGNIASFAADFTQYDEGWKNWWNSGSIRYNSSIPVPEPATLLLLGLGAAAVTVRKKR
jgi:hypothetical protein